MTLVIAHRGSKGTHPENTFSAFKEAIDCQADGIELDVQYTKDNQLVVIHDNTVDRTTNGSGEIDSFTLAEIQQLDAGSWFDPQYKDQHIPSFHEVLLLLERNHFQGILNIEIKTDEKEYPGIEKDIVKLLQSQEWPFEYLYSSFNLNSLELAHQSDRTAAKAYVMATSAKKIKKAKELNFIEAIHPKITWVNEQGNLINKYPKAVRPWTVNEEADMILCFQQDLAGIHTDYPRKALACRKAMKRTLQF